MMFTGSSETIGLNLKNIKFLAVEDHDFTRHLLVNVLRALGAGDIETAANGRSAVALLQSFPPDVVITDCWMAPVGGIALARYLRTHPASPNPFVPIIMITTDTRPSCVRRARDAGVNEVLIKPFWPRALYDRICRAVLSPRPFVNAGRYFGPDRRERDGTRLRDADDRRCESTATLPFAADARPSMSSVRAEAQA